MDIDRGIGVIRAGNAHEEWQRAGVVERGIVGEQKKIAPIRGGLQVGVRAVPEGIARWQRADAVDRVVDLDVPGERGDGRGQNRLGRGNRQRQPRLK